MKYFFQKFYLKNENKLLGITKHPLIIENNKRDRYYSRSFGDGIHL